MNKNKIYREPTPEERRRAFIRNSRETTRIVKRTLIALALFAGLYYIFLLKTQSPEPSIPETIAPVVEETRATSERSDVRP